MTRDKIMIFIIHYWSSLLFVDEGKLNTEAQRRLGSNLPSLNSRRLVLMWWWAVPLRVRTLLCLFLLCVMCLYLSRWHLAHWGKDGKRRCDSAVSYVQAWPRGFLFRWIHLWPTVSHWAQIKTIFSNLHLLPNMCSGFSLTRSWPCLFWDASIVSAVVWPV